VTYGTFATPCSTLFEKDDNQLNFNGSSNTELQFMLMNLSGATMLNEAIQLQHFTTLLQTAGVTFRKWLPTAKSFRYHS
jgi:type II secretory pathway component PulK